MVSGEGIVVIGVSNSGLGALPVLLAALPTTLTAPVLVAVDLPAGSAFPLEDELGPFSALPVRAAEDGAKITAGVVLVAPPRHHLLIDGGQVEVARTARDQARASVGLLLESAARTFGSRVRALVLSADMGDIGPGLAAVIAAGGTCVLQDPGHALWPDMPVSAAGREVCGLLPVELLADWLGSPAERDAPDRRARVRKALEVAIDEQNEAATTAARIAASGGLAGQPFAVRQFRSRARTAKERADLLSRRVAELSVSPAAVSA